MSPQRRAHYRNVSRAHETRVSLVLALSPTGTCQSCGKKPKNPSALQIDHVNGRSWMPREHNQWTRAKRYWDEYRAGEPMRALCKKCNGSYRPPTYYDKAQAELWQQQTKMVPDEPKPTRKAHASSDRHPGLDVVIDGVPF